MTWEIFLGIAALFGFIITAVKTILPLTNAVTLLTEQVANLRKDMDAIEKSKKESHTKIWKHNEEQDERIENHEKRLHALDGK